MAFDPALLDFLLCPESREKLTLANEALVARINGAISAGTLKSRGGSTLKLALEGALVRADGKFAYPVVDDIPNLLIDEAISLEQLG